jgi:pyridoxal phosphate enzyme (YggS family)
VTVIRGDPEELRARRRALEDRIAGAARRGGRDPGDVTIVAVTKTVPADRVRSAVWAGFRTFGENRVQEAETKVDVASEGLEPRPSWHLVGPLQSNKARRAVALFDVIETVDSVDLAVRLDRIAAEVRPDARLPVLLQVNVDADPTKAGFDPAAVGAALPEILELPRLEIAGLMTVGRLVASAEEARPTFVALRRLSEDLRRDHPTLGSGLSMGMTDDFDVAVEEGATIVRIGRAIFGDRD